MYAFTDLSTRTNLNILANLLMHTDLITPIDSEYTFANFSMHLEILSTTLTDCQKKLLE